MEQAVIPDVQVYFRIECDGFGQVGGKRLWPTSVSEAWPAAIAGFPKVMSIRLIGHEGCAVRGVEVGAISPHFLRSFRSNVLGTVIGVQRGAWRSRPRVTGPLGRWLWFHSAGKEVRQKIIKRWSPLDRPGC